MSSPTDLFQVIDRILLFSWLLKDFGWMTTNIYLGFIFGTISVGLHFLLFLIDTRRSYRYYNTSLLIWVTGNFIWMTVEFVDTNPSSNVHIGPHVPLGGISEENIQNMINTKTMLFLIASTIQLIMYCGIFGRCIYMPEEDNEDIISKNEIQLLCGGGSNNSSNNNTSYAKQGDFDSMFDLADDFSFVSNNNSSANYNPNYTLTLAFVENAYIIFWISKDLFWSWGTGDLTKGRDLAIVFESLAMMFGSLSIFIYLVTAYIYRRNFLRFLDSITVILWISANFVWMCGEFFIRYDNLEYDDKTEHNDSPTRLVSAVLFCSGITIQLFIFVKLVIAYKKHDADRLQQQQHRITDSSSHSEADAANDNNNSNSSSSHGQPQQQIEMMSGMFRTMNPIAITLNNNSKFLNKMFMTSFSQQQQQHMKVSTGDDDEESTVLF